MGAVDYSSRLDALEQERHLDQAICQLLCKLNLLEGRGVPDVVAPTVLDTVEHSIVLMHDLSNLSAALLEQSLGDLLLVAILQVSILCPSVHHDVGELLHQ